jgi:peptidoglycan hydrolase CwlO-like protein
MNNQITLTKNWIKTNFQILTITLLTVSLLLIVKQQYDLIQLKKTLSLIENSTDELSNKVQGLNSSIDDLDGKVDEVNSKVENAESSLSDRIDDMESTVRIYSR